MASKLVLLLAVTATLGVSFGCLADLASTPVGSSAPDPNQSLAAPEFALLTQPLRLGPAGPVLTGIPAFADSGYTSGLSRPPLYPSRR